MKGSDNKNKIGLVVGLFLAAIHALWAIAVAIIPSALQKSLDWIFAVHFLNSVFIISAFNFIDAVYLVIMSFIAGYICGWIFAAFWNWVKK